FPKRNSNGTLSTLRRKLPRKNSMPVGVGLSLSGGAKEGDLTFHSLGAHRFDFFAFADSPMRVVERNSDLFSENRSLRNFHLKRRIIEDAEKSGADVEIHGLLRVEAQGRTNFYELSYKGVITVAPVEVPAGHGVLPEMPK
ncbi:MAG: hypothetical protein KDB61_14790, partial [Planctomycetes bacterium]|nr:hypothetical protein [Planctomycetota bacterium]